VSRHHYEVVYDGLENTWKIQDKGGPNGTVIERGRDRIIIFIGRRIEA